MGKRHHFVPRFYLRQFASAEKRINLLNFPNLRAIQHASLRDQCYAVRLYGPDDTLEDAFAVIEGLSADLFRKLIATRKPPAPRTTEHDLLIAFIGFQLARTIGARTAAVKMSESLSRAVFGEVRAGMGLSLDQAMATALSAAPKMINTLGDLSSALVVAPDNSKFVTSDSPVFRYNSYCERLDDFGVIGTTRRGLQLFLPLTPQLLVMYYDAGVYKVGTRKSRGVVTATKEDVTVLNRMQCVAATNNVYFSDWSQSVDLGTMAASVRKLRTQMGPRYHVAREEGDSSSELIHQFWPMPQLRLELSFLSEQRNARRVGLSERALLVRPAYRTPTAPAERGAVRKFKVQSRG